MSKPSNDSRTRGDALQSVERWRSARLDQAQSAHMERQKIVTERTAAVESVQGLIDESQDLARAHTSENSVVSVDTLTRIRHYTTAQFEKLDEANKLLTESKREADEARLEMRRKYEELAAVERLRARRDQVAARDAERLNQKRLDDQALVRMVAGRLTKTTRAGDDE